MTWQGEIFSGGMKAHLSSRKGHSSALVALNSNVMAKTASVCGECPVANRQIEGAICHRISNMNGVAFFSFDGATLEAFLQAAACKINKIDGVDLKVPNKLNT